MKTYNDIMKVLGNIDNILLQVVSWTDPLNDLHCVIICEEDPFLKLAESKELRKFIAKTKLSFPLVITRDFLNTSLDSYPLEILNFSHQYHNLFQKEDLLKSLQFDKDDVRLQMERELKSKWLLTRMILMQNKLNERDLSKALKLSAYSILPVFKGFHYLAGLGIPTALSELLKGTSSISSIDLSMFETCFIAGKAGLHEATAYLNILTQLMKVLDEK